MPSRRGVPGYRGHRAICCPSRREIASLQLSLLVVAENLASCRNDRGRARESRGLRSERRFVVDQENVSELSDRPWSKSIVAEVGLAFDMCASVLIDGRLAVVLSLNGPAVGHAAHGKDAAVTHVERESPDQLGVLLI